MKTKSNNQDVRTLKVSRKWNGNKPVPSMNLQGIYLQEYNFNIGDSVRVVCFRDEIRILRVTPEMMYEEMKEKNPALVKLVQEFDCEICD